MSLRLRNAQTKMEELKGITNPKNHKILRFVFLLPTKYEPVADVVVKFYSCATYIKGV